MISRREKTVRPRQSAAFGRIDVLLAIGVTAIVASGMCWELANSHARKAPPDDSRQLTLQALGIGPTCDPAEIEYFPRAGTISRTQFLESWPELHTLWPSDTMPTLEAVEEQAKQDKSTAGVQLLLALLHYHQNSLDDAETLVRDFVTSESEQHLHHYLQALIITKRLQAANDPFSKWSYSTALQKTYERAFALRPDIAVYRTYLIFAYEQTPRGFGGDPARADELIAEALANEDERFLLIRAKLNLMHDDIDAASADLDECLEHRRYYAPAFTSAVQELVTAGNLARADRYAIFAVTAEKNRAASWYALGTVRAAMGDKSVARKCLDEALRIAPASQAARAARMKLGDDDAERP